MTATNAEKRRFLHEVRKCLQADILQLEDMTEMIALMSRACDRVLEWADTPCWAEDDNIGLLTKAEEDKGDE